MNRRAAVVTLVVLAISSVANAGIHMGDAAQLRRAYRALGSDDPTIRGRATVYLGNLDEVLALSARSYKRLTPSPTIALDEWDSLMRAVQSSDFEAARIAAVVIGLLQEKGEAAVPALTQLLQNDQAPFKARFSACSSLALVQSREQAVGPLVLPLLKAATFKNVEALKYARMLINSDRTLVELPYLIEATSRKYPGCVRLSALGILQELGAEARPVVESLRRLVRTEDIEIRSAAVMALVEIEANPPLALDSLRDSRLEGEIAGQLQKALDLRIQSDERRRAELQSIDPDTVWIYTSCLEKECSGVGRRNAIRALGGMGQRASSALPELRDLLRHPEEATRRLAAEAIRKIESDR